MRMKNDSHTPSDNESSEHYIFLSGDKKIIKIKNQ